MPSSTLHLHCITTDATAFKTLHRHPSSPPQLVPLPPHLLDDEFPRSLAAHHVHQVSPNQCCSAVVRTIAASVSSVWSVVRCFDNPQAYKHFLKSCAVIFGDGLAVGSLREVHVVSGMPAGTSTERLEILDDVNHVISFSVVGGDHRLVNYRSVTTLHSTSDGSGTVVVESYVVDVPSGNTRDDTCAFVDTIVRCNLQSLAQIAEKNGSSSSSRLSSSSNSNGER
uniref:Abscisic acid receptor PYL4 n=1 Tax=Kalanchoe fedtschenkoi TaxID=63787 RepID=A0A7N0TGL2_KALFE